MYQKVGILLLIYCYNLVGSGILYIFASEFQNVDIIKDYDY